MKTSWTTEAYKKALEEREKQLEERENKVAEKERKQEQFEIEKLIMEALEKHEVLMNEETRKGYVKMLTEATKRQEKYKRWLFVEDNVIMFKKIVKQRTEEDYQRLVQFALIIAKTVQI